MFNISIGVTRRVTVNDTNMVWYGNRAERMRKVILQLLRKAIDASIFDTNL
jgi:hypothetical protein